MAEHDQVPAQEGEPSGAASWDGRFGASFDDEVSTKGVAYTIVGTCLVTVIAMVLMLGLLRVLDRGSDEARPQAGRQPTLQPAPPLPRLQADPEGELEAFRAQLDERLSTYGWVDEDAGIAHLPIDIAIAILAERGLPQPAAAAAPDQGAGAAGGVGSAAEDQP